MYVLISALIYYLFVFFFSCGIFVASDYCGRSVSPLNCRRSFKSNSNSFPLWRYSNPYCHHSFLCLPASSIWCGSSREPILFTAQVRTDEWKHFLWLHFCHFAPKYVSTLYWLFNWLSNSTYIILNIWSLLIKFILW